MPNNTGNPVPSISELDFEDNCENLDKAMSSNDLQFTDRLGVDRYTWHGLTELVEIAAGRANNAKGWTPVFSIEADGARNCLKLASYTGGTGDVPTNNIGRYVGPAGYVTNIASAVDIRGSVGSTGNKGWSPQFSLIANGEKVVQRLVSWTGGEGTAPNQFIGWYVGTAGYTPNINDGIDIRGPKGADELPTRYVATRPEAVLLANSLPVGSIIIIDSDSTNGNVRTRNTVGPGKILTNTVKDSASNISASGGVTVQQKLDEIVSGAATQIQVDTALTNHNSDAGAHPELSAFISSEADRAEAARDAAEDAAQYDYLVDDDAALAAITGMTTGQRAFVRDTEHVWRYDGSDWIDLGLAPTAGKADKSRVDEIELRVDYDDAIGADHLVSVIDGVRRILAACDAGGAWSLLQKALSLSGGARIYEYESLQPGVAVLVDATGRIISTFNDSSVDAEVQQARGSRAALNDRLSQHMNAYGLPNQHVFGEWYLRETKQRIRKLLLGETRQLVIASIGDSWTHARTRYSGPTADSLKTEFGNAGPGWTGFAWGFGGASNVWAGGNGSASADVAVALSANWSVAYYTTASPDLGGISTSTPGAKVTVTYSGSGTLSAVRLHHVSGSGVLRYRWNGGAWTTLDISAGAGAAVATLAGVPAGGWTLEIENVEDTTVVCGVDLQSSADGVRWHKLGATGSQAAHWIAVNASQWQGALTQLAPNLVTILLGTNDQNSFSAAAFKSNVQALIARVRAAVPLADILLIAPCENGRANSIPMSEYARVTYELAAEQKCAFLGLQYLFGETFSEYASTSPRNWFNADLIHPEPLTGGRVIVDAVMRILTTQ